MASNKSLIQLPQITTAIIAFLVLVIIFLTYKVVFLSGLNSQIRLIAIQQDNLVGTESASSVKPDLSITITPTKAVVDNSKAIAECLSKLNQFEAMALASGYPKAEVGAMVAAGKEKCKSARELTPAEKESNKINNRLDTIDSKLDSIKNKQDYGF